MYFFFQSPPRWDFEVNVCDDIDLHQQNWNFVRLVGAKKQYVTQKSGQKSLFWEARLRRYDFKTQDAPAMHTTEGQLQADKGLMIQITSSRLALNQAT